MADAGTRDLLKLAARRLFGYRSGGLSMADNQGGEVSWIAPIARALLKSREGDEVQLVTPGGVERIDRKSVV